MGKDNTMLSQMDEIVRNTLESIENSKKQIFEMAEEARCEYKLLEQKLIELQQRVKATIEEVEHLELLERRSRQKLMAVSKNFKQYGEEQIRRAYDNAKDLQIQLVLKREHEQLLVEQRMELERQIKKVKTTIDHAEHLISHISSAMNYLNIALTNIDDAKEELQHKEEMGVRIIMAQEDERRRVAMDIHDGPAQTMSNVVLKCEICEKLIDVDLERTRESIRELKQLVRMSLQDIRKIIYDLRPMSLDDLGLIPTLQRYVENFISDTNIDVVLDLYPSAYKLDSVIEVAVFRIIQEALNNILKYSKATQVCITLKLKNDILLGAIMDNGIGFNLDAALVKSKAKGNSGGYGLYGMKQRAELLNGKLKIQSQPGHGTVIRLEIPINSPKEEEFHE